MERQYIGARYVPLFMGDWNDQQVYQPLSIVQYLGSSYTSKKDVPAGVLPTNTNYWANTGNYNQQVESYRQEVVAMQETVSATEDKVDELNNTLSFPSGGHIVIAGDSNMVRLGELTEWADFLPDFTYESVAESGAGWVSTQNTPGVWAQLRNVTGTPNVILILSGGNDCRRAVAYKDGTTGSYLGAPDVADHNYLLTNPSQVFPAIKSALGFIRETWPKAQVYFLARPNFPDSVTRQMWAYYSFYTAQIMKEWGVPVIDSNALLNYSNFMGGEGMPQDWALETPGRTHYSTEMNIRWCKKICSILESGSPCSFGFEKPSVFYVPTIENDSNDDDKQAMKVNWVMNHCMSIAGGTFGDNIMGVAIASTNTRFIGVGHTEANGNGIIFFSNTKMRYAIGSRTEDNNILSITQIPLTADARLQDQDLDSFTTSGWYYFNVANDNVTNYPAGLSGAVFLHVKTMGGLTLQEVYPIAGNDEYYKRRAAGGTGTWYKFTGSAVT